MTTLKNTAQVTINITKKTADKTKRFFKLTKQKVIDSTNRMPVGNALTQKGVSGQARLLGSKRCSLKDFSERASGNNYVKGNIEFRPAHRWNEFKLHHHTNVWANYSRIQNKTFIFMEDEGFIDFHNMFGGNPEGIMIVFDGLVSWEDFTKASKFDKLLKSILTTLYWERDEQIQTDIAADSSEEKVAA